MRGGLVSSQQTGHRTPRPHWAKLQPEALWTGAIEAAPPTPPPFGGPWCGRGSVLFRRMARMTLMFVLLYYDTQTTTRDALEGEGAQRWPQGRLDRRLEEVAKAAGDG